MFKEDVSSMCAHFCFLSPVSILTTFKPHSLFTGDIISQVVDRMWKATVRRHLRICHSDSEDQQSLGGEETSEISHRDLGQWLC